MANSGDADGSALTIEVLLHEYDALRAEIVARTSSRFQLVGLAAVAATLVTAKWAGYWWGITLIILGTAVFAGVIWAAFRLYINRCAARTLQIENEINTQIKQINTQTNESVLIWETHLLPLQWRRGGWRENKFAMRERWDEALRTKEQSTIKSAPPGG